MDGMGTVGTALGLDALDVLARERIGDVGSHAPVAMEVGEFTRAALENERADAAVALAVAEHALITARCGPNVHITTVGKPVSNCKLSPWQGDLEPSKVTA